MFDVGFSELILIAVVALIVIGPERLPKVARTLGHLAGRMQRYVNDVKADINREMQFEELQKLRAELKESANSIETTVNREVHSVETSLNTTVHDAEPMPTASTEEVFDAIARAETHDEPGERPQMELGLAPSGNKPKPDA